MMNGIENILVLLGRLAVSGFFLWAALEKIRHWNAATDYLRKKKISHISYVLPIGMAFQAVGGLCLLFGFYSRIGALLLLIYMILHTFRIHDFWKQSEGPDRTVEKLFFMKDIAIIGGLLVLLAIGAGHFAITH